MISLLCNWSSLVLGFGARRKAKVHVPHQRDTIARQDLKFGGDKAKIERLDWDPQNLYIHQRQQTE
jgi:hypothetical protein